MKTLLLTISGVLLFSFSFAQRETDLKVTLLSPEDGSEIAPMQSFQLEIQLINQSTEPFLAADSLAVYLIMNGDTVPNQNNNFWVYSDIFMGTGEEHTIQKTMAFDHSALGAHIDLCIFVKPFNRFDPVTDPGLQDNMGCKGIDVVEAPVTGLDEKKAPAVRLYPNPVKNMLYLESENPVSTVTVIDLSGKEVLYATNVSQIDCSGLGSGIYFVKIATQPGETISKIMVE